MRGAERRGEQGSARRKAAGGSAGDNVIRLLPPLTVSEDEIRIGLERIRAGIAKLSSMEAGAGRKEHA